MSLREKVKSLSGNKRRFVLLRIADMDTKAALKLIGVVRGTYNSWLQNDTFVELYREVKVLAAEHKQEAIQLLRRDNQLEAVLLESKIIAELKNELENKEYVLTKTHLAREVYSKLIAELDAVPKTQMLSWEQKVQQIFTVSPEQIVEGEVIDAEFTPVNQQESQLEESQLEQESQQTPDTDEKETQT